MLIILTINMEKGVQVCVNQKELLKKPSNSQTALSYYELKDTESQCGWEKCSYGQSEKVGKWTYDQLKDEVIGSKLVHGQGINHT